MNSRTSSYSSTVYTDFSSYSLGAMNNRANSYGSSRAPPPEPLHFTTSHASTLSSSSVRCARGLHRLFFHPANKAKTAPAYEDRDLPARDYRACRVDSAGSATSTGSYSGSPTMTQSASYPNTFSSPFPPASATAHRTAAGTSAGAGASASKKNVNVYTTCGRHSNEWLFGGWAAPFRRRDNN